MCEDYWPSIPRTLSQLSSGGRSSLMHRNERGNQPQPGNSHPQAQVKLRLVNSNGPFHSLSQGFKSQRRLLYYDGSLLESRAITSSSHGPWKCLGCPSWVVVVFFISSFKC